MSGPPVGPGPPGSRSGSFSNAPPSAGPPHGQQRMATQPSSTAQTPTGPGSAIASQQNLNQIVIEYLSKKGYNRTEAMLRREAAHQDADGRPIISRVEDSGGLKYEKAFVLTRDWIEETLYIYKAELQRLLWPLFVYFFINLVAEYYPKESEAFFRRHRSRFQREHEEDVRALSSISLPDHLLSNPTVQVYRNNRYRLTLSNVAHHNLIMFLESKERDGGAVVINVIQSCMNLIAVERAALSTDHSLATILARKTTEDELPAEDEGVPGHNPGSANTEPGAHPVLPKLALGPMPKEPELMEDVKAQVQEEDEKHPPVEGQPSLAEEFEKQIKEEQTEDAPSRDNIPLPPSLARDIAVEVQKIKENRERFKIERRTGGVGPGLSVTMLTFHNTYDSINCLDFSGDYKLVAAGTSESYVRVWTVDGKPLTGATSNGTAGADKLSSSRRLIGHSGPVYGVSFSPAIAQSVEDGPTTNARYLISCSADKSVRLWSLETWSCLVVYKGHDNPVWDVTWGPFGHYFATASHDRTARLWSTDNVAPLRIFAGHDNDVDHVVFHPNGAYIFTGSSDKTVRMWDVSRGNPVRLFTGHTGNITALSCAPNGRTLASADDQGSIILWELGLGRRIKRMRGHAKGGIWSLAWSAESTVLVSGGADCVLRVWDSLQTTSESTGVLSAGLASSGTASTPTANGKNLPDGNNGVIKTEGIPTTAGPGGGGNAPIASAAAGAGGGKRGKGAKEVVVSADQISAFPTKKSPIYQVYFTRMNLVLAGGAYLP